ncbi:outer membrane protein [Vibrio sp. V39_P1S14PM300]|uniref:outer membrane protein n=1 Tax=Vibrio sp. V39_P1S14PM300 TaxID=1938690 RepID=UPI001372CF9A|nr:outer membrane beta-barrel protein [Vibrio sp. V39_P1S14PM300]NAX20882.1 porin family protein [Vibrio sp. V39_P1S14PM300]
MCKHYLTVSVLGLLSFASPGQAQSYITPWIGYTFGGEVENQDGHHYDIKGSENVAFSVETDIQAGRIGVFYAYQSSEIEHVKLDSKVHYLQFQSSLYYPIQPNFSSYLGLGVGGSYIDAKWVDDQYGFSASIFGGVQYDLTQNLSLNGQFRWLGTVVDNDTTAACTLPTSESDSCLIRFETDWMNQFSTNIGLVMRF